MGKFLLFPLLWWLFGNPIVAIVVLLLIMYVIDRRFIGLSPSLLRPLKRRRHISRLRQQLLLNPNDIAAKHDIARLYMEQRNYREARRYLESIGDVLEHSAEYWDDLGACCLRTGDIELGEQAIGRALALNPRVKYGQPYLRLAAHYSRSDAEKALEYLEAFRTIQSSSCEGYFRLGSIYEQIGRAEDAAAAYGEGVHIYRSLPKYKRRQERKWAFRCMLKKRRRQGL